MENGDRREARAQKMMACLLDFSAGEVRRGLVVPETDMNFSCRFYQYWKVGSWQLPTGFVEKREIAANKCERLACPFACVFVERNTLERNSSGRFGLSVFAYSRASENSKRSPVMNGTRTIKKSSGIGCDGVVPRGRHNREQDRYRLRAAWQTCCCGRTKEIKYRMRISLFLVAKQLGLLGRLPFAEPGTAWQPRCYVASKFGTLFAGRLSDLLCS